MAFSEYKIGLEWLIAAGSCERCQQRLSWDKRGHLTPYSWEPHHKDGDPNNDSIVNCEILCWDCYDKILSGL